MTPDDLFPENFGEREGKKSEEIARIENSQVKNEAISEFAGKNKVYKYPTIYLRLNEEREATLKGCASALGFDPSRVDDHQAELIWDILGQMDRTLRFRNKVKDIIRDMGFTESDLK